MSTFKFKIQQKRSKLPGKYLGIYFLGVDRKKYKILSYDTLNRRYRRCIGDFKTPYEYCTYSEEDIDYNLKHSDHGWTYFQPDFPD